MLCEQSIEQHISIYHQLDSSTIGNTMFVTDSNKLMYTMCSYRENIGKSLNIFCSRPYKKLSFKKQDFLNICFYLLYTLHIIHNMKLIVRSGNTPLQQYTPPVTHLLPLQSNLLGSEDKMILNWLKLENLCFPYEHIS